MPATNNMNILHNYTQFDKQLEVGVFSIDQDKEITLQAVGQGSIKIISRQDSIVCWPTSHKPTSTDTVISPDNYQQNNLS